MFREVIYLPGCVGQFLNQTLTGSMERWSRAAVPCPVIREVRPHLVFTKQGERKALKETFSWPSQESADIAQIYHPMLC